MVARFYSILEVEILFSNIYMKTCFLTSSHNSMLITESADYGTTGKCLFNLTSCVLCAITSFVNWPTICTFYIFIYLFYNFHVHCTCFERSCRSSSGILRSVMYYAPLYNRAHVFNCSWTQVHDCTEVRNTVHCVKFLMMNDKIARNVYNEHENCRINK